MSNLRIAPEGSGRFDHAATPAEEGRDLSAYRERALDDVVSVILAHGQYPAPRRNYWNGRGGAFTPQRRQFDLLEWIDDNVGDSVLRENYFSMITDFSVDHDSRRLREASRVEAILCEQLRDSEMVTQRAEELYQEAREER